MQLVKWGKKGKEVKVPVGWNFLKEHNVIHEKDRVFNPKTHAFDEVSLDPEQTEALRARPPMIVIRANRSYNDTSVLDKDPHAIRVSE